MSQQESEGEGVKAEQSAATLDLLTFLECDGGPADLINFFGSRLHCPMNGKGGASDKPPNFLAFFENIMRELP